MKHASSLSTPAGIHQRAGPGPPLLVDEQLALRCEHRPCPALGKEAELALKTTTNGSDEERPAPCQAVPSPASPKCHSPHGLLPTGDSRDS